MALHTIVAYAILPSRAIVLAQEVTGTKAEKTQTKTKKYSELVVAPTSLQIIRIKSGETEDRPRYKHEYTHLRATATIGFPTSILFFTNAPISHTHSFPEPVTLPPPWIQTMTGMGSSEGSEEGAGTVMVRLQHSNSSAGGV